MSVIITMAGAGSRFTEQGYTVPKYRVMANKKTLFEWSLLSLKNFFNCQRFIFACLEQHDRSFISEKAKALGIQDFIIHTRKEVSKGQAETAYDCLKYANQEESLWIFNIDTYVSEGFSPYDIEDGQGCLHVFKSENPSMSFVRYDDSGAVLEIAEKKVISSWATVGMYGFETALLFREIYKQAFLDDKSLEVQGERYIAPMYQLLIERENKVLAPKLSSINVHILGTPSEVKIFDSHAVPPLGAV